MTDDTRERLIKLETEFDHMSRQLDTMAVQVKDMHELLLQARGARWAIIGLASLGGFISAKLTTILPWFAAAPK